jgi:hypothetical protein
MITAFRGALRLADEGLITECYTLLRPAADFAAEIIFLAEGIIAGKFNSSQREFIDQFFAPFPTSPDELAERDRQRYVARKEIISARTRLFHKGLDSAQMKRIIAFLNKTHDAYVHGAYTTAMELFSGETQEFMLRGHPSAEKRFIAKGAVCAKLHEGIVALELMARTRGLKEVVAELGIARNKLLRESERK